MKKEDVKKLEFEFYLRVAEIVSFVLLTFIIISFYAITTFLGFEVEQNRFFYYVVIIIIAFFAVVMSFNYINEAKKILDGFRKTRKRRKK